MSRYLLYFPLADGSEIEPGDNGRYTAKASWVCDRLDELPLPSTQEPGSVSYCLEDHSHWVAGVDNSWAEQTGVAVVTHPDLATHDALGLATDAELSTKASTTALTDGLATKSDTAHAHASYSTTGHAHAESDVTNLTGDLTGKAASVHTHAENQVTNLTTDLAGKSNTGHAHAESEVTSLVTDLAAKSGTAHTHTHAATTGQGADDHHGKSHIHDGADGSGTVTYANVGSKPASFTPSAHAHPESDVTSLTTDLQAKAASVHTHAEADVTALVSDLAGKSGTAHGHAYASLSSIPATFAPAAHAHVEADTTNLVNDLAGKAATAHTHALSTAQAFATATTSISLAAYADVAGASISLAAGTWLVEAVCSGMAVNAAFLMNVAITDGANAVVVEGAQNVPASGTASVNAWGNVALSAIVAPVGTTTYKLRAARGNAAPTTTYTVGDGAATATANNASDNTDKGTSIRAIRVA